MNMFLKPLTKLSSKGFQSIIEGHRYADIRQLLSLFTFVIAMTMKQTKLKIAVTEN